MMGIYSIYSITSIYGIYVKLLVQISLECEQLKFLLHEASSTSRIPTYLIFMIFVD